MINDVYFYVFLFLQVYGLIYTFSRMFFLKIKKTVLNHHCSGFLHMTKTPRGRDSSYTYENKINQHHRYETFLVFFINPFNPVLLQIVLITIKPQCVHQLIKKTRFAPLKWPSHLITGQIYNSSLLLKLYNDSQWVIIITTLWGLTVVASKETSRAFVHVRRGHFGFYYVTYYGNIMIKTIKSD